MPTARRHIDVDGHSIEIQIEFEVWCKVCGNGICGNTTYVRGSNNHFSTYCEVCEDAHGQLNKDYDALVLERDDLQEQIERLELEIQEIKETK
jgi:hypothetical protein